MSFAPTLPPAVYLPSTSLSDDERALVSWLLDRLRAVSATNLRKEAYYDGRARVRDLGIAIPPHLRDIRTVVGWPGTVVDVLEERLDHQGWTVPGVEGDDPLGVSTIVEENDLTAEFGAGHLDALVYGIAFLVVGAGEPDEPSPLVTAETPKRMTGRWNRRRRALDAALAVTVPDGETDPSHATLYLPGETIELAVSGRGWTVEEREVHDLDGLPVEPLVNRPRSGDYAGRSEITPAIRAYTDNAVRTVLGMEVAREFFSAPQRYVLGASEEAFVGPDGTPRTAWESYIGKVLALTANEHGDLPSVGSFSASSPQPFLAQLDGLAKLVAAESGMAPAYLGITTDNPSSADAIRAGDVRLQKRAERRQRAFGAAEGRILRKAIHVRDGEDPGVTPRPVWRDAATPTRSAAADEATKLISSGVLPPDSDVTYERVGLSEVDRRRLRDDGRRRRAVETVGALRGAAADDDRDVKARADALGTLIRAGVEPTVAAQTVGLDGVAFTGAIPVSLRPLATDADRLED